MSAWLQGLTQTLVDQCWSSQYFNLDLSSCAVCILNIEFPHLINIV
uniref:Uncharacterized protein n=1 Tax=Anguilla anguilla TaxID=7936 RepID=A0A0E9UB12_ANGAN